MPRLRSIAVALLAAAPLAGLLALARPAPAAASDPGFEAEMVGMLNADRAQQGLAPLSVDPALTAVAEGWSDSLVVAGALSHNPRIVSELPTDWTRWGENVGTGPSPSAIEAAFMASPPHRENILGAFTLVGVGVADGANGALWITVDFLTVSGAPACTDVNPPAAPSPAAASGYYVLGSDGGVFSFGSAVFHGSVPGLGVRAQAVLMAVTPDGGGYWVLGTDGGVFSFGDAGYFGSVPGLGARTTAVDLKPTRSGRGYWVLGQDGSVFTFGDARPFGSLPSSAVVDRAVKLVPTTTGSGYWVLGADGGVFSFGDAAFHGSLPASRIGDTSVSMAATADSGGYWVLGGDGGIFSFGDAAFHGSVPGIGCTVAQGVQIVATADGGGYYILASDGRVFSFGDAPPLGDPSGFHVTARDLAVASAG
jgi:hypothetical protein